jgi:hypothetical protein
MLLGLLAFQPPAMGSKQSGKLAQAASTAIDDAAGGVIGHGISSMSIDVFSLSCA